MTARRFTDAEEREIEKIYRVGGLGTEAVARQYRCSAKAIKNAIRRVGGRVRTCQEANALSAERCPCPSGRYFADAEEREIEKIYRVGQFSTGKIARQYLCSAGLIRNAVLRAGGQTRTPREGTTLWWGRNTRNAHTCLTDAEEREIEKIYRVGRFSSQAIARQYSCSSGTILNAVKHAGGKTRTRKEARVQRAAKNGREPTVTFADAEEREIEKIYRVGRFSANEIARQYPCSPQTVLAAVRRTGGRARTLQEATALRFPNLICWNGGDYPIVSVSRLRGNARIVARQTVGTGYVIPVHRLIMALHLRRPLLPTEIVHHRDGNKANYRIGNLELLTQETHTSAWGDPYYQRWQEALTEIGELRAKIETLQEAQA